MELVRSGVGGSDECLGDYPLADRKTGSKRLVGDVGYRGRGVVDADPRGEPTKGLESPSNRVSRKLLCSRISGQLTLRIARAIRRSGSLA